ncbi:hypothetical protein SpCBS45565_g07043 [Spizellomyces sp. 'palustris']|nr:hypothetical protein SpCBS45565_g07043 [Spizellomyces sp. 'palustris']
MAKNHKKSASGAKPSDNPSMGFADEPVTTDARFTRVYSDPRFIKTRKDATKVTIDSRFSKMLKSEEFGTGVATPRVDKYGRPTKKTASKDLERFYKLDEEEMGVIDQDRESLSTSEVDESMEEKHNAVVAGYDLARGEGLVESDSDDEPDEDIEADDEIEDTIDVGPYAEENVPTGDETHRFAVVNLDWDHVKAKDLFKVFDAFKPAQGAIMSVKIYPSEFGKERLEREAREGPPADIFGSPGGDDVLQPLIRAEDGTEDYDNIKLRKYQMERLKYYYAVVECDSVETARAIYKTCDGTEYEKSANFFDLRYIPTGMDFDDSPSDEACDVPAAYQPKDFVTQALQHSKVKLTWDEDDDDRVRITRRKFTKNDLQDMDFKAYLASASEDEESDDDAQSLRAKYQALLQGNTDGNRDAFGNKETEEELEITFAPGLSEKAAALLEKKKERDTQKDETVFEQYLRKQKEKRKAKKTAQKELDDEPLVSSGDEEIDMDDPFFSEEFGPEYQPKVSDTSESKQPKKALKSRKPTADDVKSKAELELLMLQDEGGPNSRHFDMKEVIKEEKGQRKKKGRKPKKERREGGVQDGFEIDIKDPRFASVLESHHFAIDPNNPQFKKTQAMEKVLQERRKRRDTKEDGQTVPQNRVPKAKGGSEEQTRPDTSNLSVLVESVSSPLVVMA